VARPAHPRRHGPPPDPPHPTLTRPHPRRHGVAVSMCTHAIDPRHPPDVTLALALALVQCSACAPLPSTHLAARPASLAPRITPSRRCDLASAPRPMGHPLCTCDRCLHCVMHMRACIDAGAGRQCQAGGNPQDARDDVRRAEARLTGESILHGRGQGTVVDKLCGVRRGQGDILGAAMKVVGVGR